MDCLGAHPGRNGTHDAAGGLKRLLSRWGYAAETAVDGADALLVAGTHEGSRTKTEAGRLAFGYLRKPVDVTRLKGLGQSCYGARVALRRFSLVTLI